MPTEPRDAGLSLDAFDRGNESQDAGLNPDVYAPIALVGTTQRSGDPQLGYDALVNAGYIGCGVPHSAYATVNGAAPLSHRLSGRTGLNETLPYNQSAFTTSSSVVVVSANCLTCHAAFHDGELVMGLGEVNTDYTNDPSQAAELAGFLVNDPAERIEWRKWADRVKVVSPYIQAAVIGVNPADNLAGILFAHRDQKTLAWSDTPLIEPPPELVIPIDVPPWWRMKKRNTMFYTAAGRGDHARIMMTASTLCIDEVDEARQIDEYFNHVRAYISSIEAPAYPGMIDQTLATQGQVIFGQNCARCHGSYGDTDTYPNLLIPIEEIGTDPIMAQGASGYSGRFVEWFNGSFYGETAYLEPLAGYIAPPLDGIWVTAPYLHNGSVPTLEMVLNSSTRPKYWSRSYRNDDYNLEIMGWNFTVEDHGHADEPNAQRKKQIYDTTLFGYSNSGHTYGDALSNEERRALLEYLKTL